MKLLIRSKSLLAVTMLVAGVCGAAMAQNHWPISNSTSDFADVATSPFGIRNNAGFDYHAGLDIAAAMEGNVFAIDDGTVIFWDWDAGGGGWTLKLDGWWFIHQYLHLYAYAMEIDDGVWITQGQYIARSGNSGCGSCGPHLHLGIIESHDATYGPRVNPVSELPFYDGTCPSLYQAGWPQVYYTANNMIDYITFTTAVPKTELDFYEISFWLYKPNQCKVTYIRMDDVSSRNDNNARLGPNWTYSPSPDWAVNISASPRSFNSWDSYHYIDWTLDPVNNTYPNTDWLGISVTDVLDPNANVCSGVSGAIFGNTTGFSPAIAVWGFEGKYLGDASVELRWNGMSLPEVQGLQLWRATDSTGQYSMITEQLLPVEGVENRYVDTVSDGGVYYYRYGLVYRDGTSRLFPEVARIQVLLPTSFSLGQNYPNPFNPATTIKYSLSAEDHGNVKLEIFNLLGQCVRTLYNGVQDQGQYSLTWDGTSESGQGVGSGVYFYRLVTPTHRETKRMILLK